MTLWQALRAAWPNPARRDQVCAGYRALATTHPMTLADIAARAGLYTAAEPGTDGIALAVAEGRRQLALEILALARTPPDDVHQLLHSGGTR